MENVLVFILIILIIAGVMLAYRNRVNLAIWLENARAYTDEDKQYRIKQLKRHIDDLQCELTKLEANNNDKGDNLEANNNDKGDNNE